MDHHDGAGTTHLLIDGENIDTTLGVSILGGRPSPDERPRWERLLTYFGDRWGQEVNALFFIAVHGENLPLPFVQALIAIGYTPIPLTGPPDVKVVDVAIMRTMEAIADRGGDVVLASHDGDFLPQAARLLREGRRVGVVAFREFLNGGYVELVREGLEIVDMEHDAGAFTYRLPRTRIIPIEEFDPQQFI